jgi:hypothetical protein
MLDALFGNLAVLLAHGARHRWRPGRAVRNQVSRYMLDFTTADSSLCSSSLNDRSSTTSAQSTCTEFTRGVVESAHASHVSKEAQRADGEAGLALITCEHNAILCFL